METQPFQPWEFAILIGAMLMTIIRLVCLVPAIKIPFLCEGENGDC